MSSEGNEKRSPYTRPGFIAAAGVVGLIIVCAIVLGIVNLSRPATEPAPTSALSAPTSSASPPTSTDASICGLGGVELNGSVTTTPQATWKYQDVLAYPTSAAAGPGATDPSGYRYCFARTPDGALFAAANITVMSFDDMIRSSWLPYVVSSGEYRNALISAALNASSSNIRANVAGFRMLSYDGARAFVDVAFQATGSGQLVTGSFAVHLVWSDGDWKIDGSQTAPTNIGQLPNLAGYTSWAAG